VFNFKRGEGGKVQGKLLRVGMTRKDFHTRKREDNAGKRVGGP